MLSFLCESHIKDIINYTRRFVNRNTAIRNWSKESRQNRASWKPFQDLKLILESAPDLLSQSYHCLLLESFMLLNPGDVITCLICSDHPFLKDKTLMKKWSSLQKNCSFRIPCVQSNIKTLCISPFQFGDF